MLNRLINIDKQKKQVIQLYTTTLGSVVLGMLASIINTRFMDAADYGDVRYVQNIINLVASLLLFGYFLSGSRLLALSNNQQYSRRVRGAMIVILALTSIILVLSCVISYFIHIGERNTVANLFLISIPVCFFPLFSNYVNTTAQGDNHIGRLSLARILPVVIYIPLAYLYFSNFGASSTSLILLQWGCYTFILFIIICSTTPRFDNLKPVFRELNQENKDYGFQLYIGSLVMVATNYLAGISLGVFNDNNSEVGFYTLAMTVTSPLSMLPMIIGTTYFKEFARQPKIPSKVIKYTILITVLSCILFLLLIKPLVTFLYTERYAVVGTYASWLSVGYCIHGIGDMINRFLGSHGQGKIIRNSSIANGVVKIFGFTVLVYYWNTNGALLTNVLCSFIYFFVLMYYYKIYIKSNETAKI